MRKFALVGASALVLALGVASASAQPVGQDFLTRSDPSVGQVHSHNAWGTTVNEGRAAALDAATPEAPAADGFIYLQHHGR